MYLDYQLMFGVDKQMHFFSYMVVSILLGIMVLLISQKDNVKRNVSYIWMSLVTVGILEEYRQFMVPDRSTEILDAIANMLGVTVGLVVPLLLWYIVQQRGKLKLFVLYGIVLTALFLGLVYINERPFVTLDEPIHEELGRLVTIVRRE
ncbi:VanZ like family protein [Thalassobacillus cyri]|uniref:VanZ like family protein n=1 Tax=Thalassobacillus cyri TaxID=571932 RepID=A0A1H4E8R6_9BACI|nr:VanZ family protein [Thalassobacillus cyri]SEA80960.1 VanZ like family protein [Thalassobacillus cyri]